jgi:hypothetical protein
MHVSESLARQLAQLLGEDPIKQFPVNQAQKLTIKPSTSKPSKGKNGWKLAALLPDTQIGYRVYEDGSVIEFHSEPAIDIAMQIVNYANKEFGVDTIVNLGDTLDLPQQSRHHQEIAFQNSTNLAIQRAYEYLAQQRATCPDAEIVFLEGNHDCRIYKYLSENAPAVANMRQAGTTPSDWPVNSLPHLLRMDELNIKYASGYPAGEYWLNDNLRCIHGDRVNSNGSTAMKYINSNHHVSVIYGHIHRIEMLYHTNHTSTGPARNAAFSPGCLCRVDGSVPSVKGGITPNEKPVKYWENWQQGVGFAWYKDTGEFTLLSVPILDDWAVFMGQEFRPQNI